MFVANKLSGYVELVINQLGMLQVFIIIPLCLLVIGFLLFAMNKKLEKMADDSDMQKGRNEYETDRESIGDCAGTEA